MDKKIILWVVIACLVVGATGYYRIKSIEDKSPIVQTVDTPKVDKSQDNPKKTRSVKDKVKLEFDRKKDVNITKNTVLVTSKAVSLKYLPFLIAFLFITLVIGTSRESFKHLTRFALMIAVLSAIGYIILFNLEPIVGWTLKFIDSLKI